MEAIAARAEVGKPALYRRFRTKAHVAFAASVSSSAPLEVADRGDVRAELLECVHSLARAITGVPRQVYADQLAAIAADPEFAEEVQQYHARSDATVRAVLERAAARAEIDDRFDPMLAVLDLGGALIFYVMIRHGDPDRDYLEQLVDRLLFGVMRRPDA